VLSRITTGGAVYLATVCVLPIVLMNFFPINFYYGGTGLLIVVSVGLDTMQQIEGYVISRRYENVTASQGSRIRDRVQTPEV
jgi:preprotein translocase subunit SecY